MTGMKFGHATSFLPPEGQLRLSPLEVMGALRHDRCNGLLWAGRDLLRTRGLLPDRLTTY